MTALSVLIAAVIALPALLVSGASSLPRSGAPPFGAPALSTSAVAGRWIWPLPPPDRVVRGFIVGPHPWSPGHRGLDLTARPGTVVVAPAAGVVHFAGVIAGRPVLSLAHGGGLLSSFEPVTTPLRAGQPVRRGEAIGQVASGLSHCFPDTCLHWGVRRDGQYVDPLLLLQVRIHPVLLPLGGPREQALRPAVSSECPWC